VRQHTQIPGHRKTLVLGKRGGHKAGLGTSDTRLGMRTLASGGWGVEAPMPLRATKP
ncbi:hypothetical protein P7K49_006053, partial [Saguinus oedipus]